MGPPPPQFEMGRAAPQAIEREEFLPLLIMEMGFIFNGCY